MSSFADFNDLDFSSNPDNRCPVVLVLDCSSSMAEARQPGEQPPLTALNSALDVLVAELYRDPLAKRRVEVSFVVYGTEVSPATPFTTVDKIVLPTLVPSGTTSTGKALKVALAALAQRKQEYKTNGIQYYKPWVMLLTDGLATDATEEVRQLIVEGENNKRFSFFAIGVDGADMEALNSLAPRGALGLQGIKFAELFQWLSASQSAVSASAPGDAVKLPSPAGWAEV